MQKLSKIFAMIISAALIAAMLCSCAVTGADAEPSAYPDAHTVKLNGDSAVIDGKEAEAFDYTWYCDPTVSHDEDESAPAEYHTGTAPDTDAAVYADHELFYFPSLPEDDFRLVRYDGENEWAYYYKDGVHDEFIFATLPNLGGFPSDMMHTPEEAAENTVLHITEPGTYILEGEWKGQIRVDLGDKDETFTDENAKVTLVLNGVSINCSVAPGIVFYSAYECDNTWEDRDAYGIDIENTDTGANVIIADSTENTVTGTNVFRMLKPKYKDEDSAEEVKTQKKMRKTDGAFYSYVSMSVTGEAENTGKLTVNSGFEGIDSELHLFFLGGNITVNSQDDGINVNEDDVSVVKFSGGEVTLNAALGAEGDGVDSNGFIVIDGGTVSVNGVVAPDSALDSEQGIYYDSGDIIIDGKKQEYESGDVFRETGGMDGFGGPGGAEPPEGMPGGFGKGGFGGDFDIGEFKKKVAELDDDATLEDVLEILGIGGGMMGGQRPDGGQMPDGGQRPDGGLAPTGESPDMSGLGGRL